MLFKYLQAFCAVLFVHRTGQFLGLREAISHRSSDHIVPVAFLWSFAGVQAVHSQEPWLLVIIPAKKVEHPTKLPVVRTTSSQEKK